MWVCAAQKNADRLLLCVAFVSFVHAIEEATARWKMITYNQKNIIHFFALFLAITFLCARLYRLVNGSAFGILVTEFIETLYDKVDEILEEKERFF